MQHLRLSVQLVWVYRLQASSQRQGFAYVDMGVALYKGAVTICVKFEIMGEQEVADKTEKNLAGSLKYRSLLPSTPLLLCHVLHMCCTCVAAGFMSDTVWTMSWWVEDNGSPSMPPEMAPAPLAITPEKPQSIAWSAVTTPISISLCFHIRLKSGRLFYRAAQVCHIEQIRLFRIKFGPKTKCQAGLVRWLEPFKNMTISEVVIAQIC